MKFINFKTRADKKALSNEMTKLAVQLELENKFGDEVYVCMINSYVDSTLYEWAMHKLYGSYVAIIYSDRMISGQKHWTSILLNSWDKDICKNFDAEDVHPHFRFGEAVGSGGLKRLLMMASACYGAEDRNVMDKRKQMVVEKLAKNNEIIKE